MMQTSSARLLIALATYNERDNLAALVQAICATAPAADLLILDDHSPDGTGDVADELARAHAGIHVIHREGKLGLGTAILRIMQFALDGRYDLLTTMDADFSHHPRYLPALLKGMDHADVMIGSRYFPGGGIENWPLSRRLMSRATNRLVRLLLGMPVSDTSGNYRCYRVSLLRRANLDNLLSPGYSFLQEVLHRCHLAGARFGETPIVFADRRVGQSKANVKEMIGSLSALLRLGWRARFDKAAMMPAPPAEPPAPRQAA
ncbi:MAG: polyprenol monophosphomannose synthase [Planctomycetes bacterium]|nr:polyprenol monophosphomannose synthase [Planctomycetota bacterium]